MTRKNNNGMKTRDYLKLIVARVDRIETKVDILTDKHSNLKAKVFGLAGTVSTGIAIFFRYILP